MERPNDEDVKKADIGTASPISFDDFICGEVARENQPPPANYLFDPEKPTIQMLETFAAESQAPPANRLSDPEKPAFQIRETSACTVAQQSEVGVIEDVVSPPRSRPG